MAARSNRTRNDDGVVAGLATFVADSVVLQAKTLSFHWNVTGRNFNGLHALFETQYRELGTAIDELAERIRALDAHAPPSLRRMIELSRLEERDEVPDSQTMLKQLAADNTALAGYAADLADTAEEADDTATHDMLVLRTAAHEKAAWMLRASLG